MNNDLKADLAIRRLLATYTDAVWRRDPESFGACWAGEGEWKILGMHMKRRAAIVAGWLQTMEGMSWVFQVQHSPILEIHPTTAFGRVYVNEQLEMKSGVRMTSFGVYHDEYVEEQGAWRFALRHFDLFYIGPADLSGRFFPQPLMSPPPRHPDPSRAASPPISELFPAG